MELVQQQQFCVLSYRFEPGSGALTTGTNAVTRRRHCVVSEFHVAGTGSQQVKVDESEASLLESARSYQHSAVTVEPCVKNCLSCSSLIYCLILRLLCSSLIAYRLSVTVPRAATLHFLDNCFLASGSMQVNPVVLLFFIRVRWLQGIQISCWFRLILLDELLVFG